MPMKLRLFGTKYMMMNFNSTLKKHGFFNINILDKDNFYFFLFLFYRFSLDYIFSNSILSVHIKEEEMFALRNIWRTLFYYYKTRIEIRPFALLPRIYFNQWKIKRSTRVNQKKIKSSSKKCSTWTCFRF